MPDLAPVKTALLSVSDKTGLVPFARTLAAHGVRLISTGGTATTLRQAGLEVIGIEDVTGFPEIMHGRVKTLHPKVHGGLLGVRDNPQHAAQMREHAIGTIDLVCVNLYPFEQTVARPGCTEEDAIENIDIGGPSMLRSAAKNFEWVTVVTRPQQYERIAEELSRHGVCTTRGLRAELAAEVFALTSRYDGAIASYMARKSENPFPPLLSLNYVKADDLRYGENPHQSAALYREMPHGTHRPCTIASAEQLHGKELSFNNINDASAALELAVALKAAAPGKVGACVVKHTNPCGAAAAATPLDAVNEAIAGDPVAAYGGILAINAPMDDAAAERLCAKDIFLEVLIAPSFSAGGLGALRNRWANLRILAVGEPGEPPAHDVELRSLPGGLLAQTRDTRLTPRSAYVHAAGPAPSEAQLGAAAFLEATVRFLFSNAIAVGGASKERPGATRLFGAGAGQMDRVTACGLAVGKAGTLAEGAVAFSDAFFPFNDGPKLLIDAGVTCIVHPGGSKRDQDTFTLCNERGVTCLTTGVRHFRH